MDQVELIQEIDRRNAYAYKLVYKLENLGLRTAEYIEETLYMAKNANYIHGRYQAIIMLANNAIGFGDYDYGYSLLDQLDRDTLLSESTDFICMLYYGSYMIYYIEHIGDEEKAFEYAELELQSAEAHEDISEIMRVRMNMATIVSNRGMWSTAIDMYQAIIDYCISVNDIHLLTYSYENLAEVYYKIGDLQKAKVTYSKTLKYAIEVELIVIQHSVYVDLAIIHIDELNYTQAFASLDLAEDLESHIGRFQDIFRRVQTLITLYRKMKRFDAAYEEVLKLENDLNKLQNMSIKASFYKDKAALCEEMGQRDLAYETLKQYLSLIEAQNTEKLEKNISLAIHESYHKEMAMLDALASIGRELTTLSDIDEMLIKLKNEFNTILSIDSIGIGLIEGNLLHFEHYFNDGQKIEPKTTTMDSDVSLAAWCIRNNEAIVINDLNKEYVDYITRIGILPKSNDHKIQSAMFRPLTIGDEIIGVFTIQSYTLNAYSSVESKIHRIITDYLAIAVNNAKQKESLRRLSIRDHLTKLYNRRGFTEYFDNKLTLLASELKSIAIIMLDLDFFKKVNDTYGHLAGDHVLRMVGKLLIDQEESDIIAARLGGEEFAMIIVNKTEEYVLRLAEKVRLEIELMSIIDEVGQIKITTSVGLAFRTGTSNIQFNQLYFEADKALYHSKGTGRNKVSKYKE